MIDMGLIKVHSKHFKVNGIHRSRCSTVNWRLMFKKSQSRLPVCKHCCACPDGHTNRPPADRKPPTPIHPKDRPRDYSKPKDPWASSRLRFEWSAKRFKTDYVLDSDCAVESAAQDAISGSYILKSVE
ncbi:hypothetical protein DdX_19920 [Ditylenchus destructor]|uniref:Uncharacterized protein n=1 Tax=Ditylenchus destructor TaxID=166010 RepID=A0AAD4MIP7_9BILA|nr:hypothetical protein DdX_19920 [Ditylenchus destructor]